MNDTIYQDMSVYEQTKKGERLKLIKLTLKDIEVIMKLQDKVHQALPSKEVYVCTSKEELEEAIEKTGCLLGYETEEGRLVALGAYVSYGYNPHNYGYDLDFAKEQLLTVGQVEMIIVDPEYRGNGLQKKLCKALEMLARKEQKAYILATVSPANFHSLNNFLALGYSNEKEKLKYGGVRRYILCKKLV